MDWRRPDGSLDTAAFLAHCSVLGDPAARRDVDLDAVRGATVERPAWFADAACKGMGTTAFYAPGNTQATRHAMTVCAGCPVLDECREAGAGESFGVWGRERRNAWPQRSGASSARRLAEVAGERQDRRARRDDCNERLRRDRPPSGKGAGGRGWDRSLAEMAMAPSARPPRESSR